MKIHRSQNIFVQSDGCRRFTMTPAPTTTHIHVTTMTVLRDTATDTGGTPGKEDPASGGNPFR